MDSERAVRALRVHERRPVWAAFLGAAAGTAPLGPEEAFALLRSEIPAAAEVAPAWLAQRHSADAVHARDGGRAGDGDALIVDRPGIAATVFVADCVPVLIAAADRVAAVHAGWRGLAGGVLASAVRELTTAPAAKPSTFEAWIGPAIGPCCYEVGEDVAERVRASSGPNVVIQQGRKPHLDLPLAAAEQLARLGVRRVSSADCCVRCDPEWWSYRRDGPRAGRNYGFIWRE